MVNGGKVFLVGAGPGDPGLLTLKGRECLAAADVVVYDHLANDTLLALARPDAERIYAGKQGGRHWKSQSEINALIVGKARQGRMVVRLKGGDPFIFGRGGEEAVELARAGVRFEVVPGVTSAVAVPAYAGIPLTHRSITSTVAFVTGHEDPRKEQSDIDWSKIATGAGTLVFLMGVGNLERIAEQLIRHGRPKDTPVAVIEQGTSAGQRTVTGGLEHIGRLAREHAVRPPAIIVVGGVVSLRSELNWFERRPLFGRRIIITRAREQASQFRERLSALGAECIEFPTIQVIPPASWEALDRAIEELPHYQWLLFTSVNGVRFFFERLRAQGKDARALHSLRVGAIGPKTAQVCEAWGIKPDLVPAEYRAEAVVAALAETRLEGRRILLPRAAGAREILPRELARMGARVDVVTAYLTVKPREGTERVRQWLEAGKIDMITFTSSSTVTHFCEMFGSDAARIPEWLSGVVVACIGPVTAETARNKGLEVTLVPRDYTIDALIDEILGYYR